MESFESTDPKQNKFLEQWNNPETIHVGEEEIEVYDIIPEELAHERPVVFLLGFGATPAMVKRRVEILSDCGRRIMLIYAQHGINHDIQVDENLDLPDAQLRKVAALIKVLDNKNISTTDVLANSEGGMVAVMATKLYPERFHNLILEQPAGIIGKDNLLRLAFKFPLDIARSYIEAILNPELKEAMNRAMDEAQTTKPATGLKQSFKEARGMANTQIDEMLKEIKESNHGVVIVNGASDMVFPMDRVQKMVKGNMIDGFYSVKGRHSQIRNDEDLEAYSRIADQALTALEKKETKEKVQEYKSKLWTLVDRFVSDGRAGEIASLLANKSDELKSRYPNVENYAFWHIIAGSTIVPDSETISDDFPGDDSVALFIDKLANSETLG